MRIITIHGEILIEWEDFDGSEFWMKCVKTIEFQRYCDSLILNHSIYYFELKRNVNWQQLHNNPGVCVCVEISGERFSLFRALFLFPFSRIPNFHSVPF